MITITYNHGEVSLLNACAAAKQLIQFQAVGSAAEVRSVSNKMTIIMGFVVEADHSITETTDMIFHAAVGDSKQLPLC